MICALIFQLQSFRRKEFYFQNFIGELGYLSCLLICSW